MSRRRRPRWVRKENCSWCGAAMEPLAAWVSCPLRYTGRGWVDGNSPIVSSIHHCRDCGLLRFIQRGAGCLSIESFPVGEVVVGRLPWWLWLDHEHIRDDPHYKSWVSERLEKLLLMESL